ncbi:MAG: phosphatidylserine decarboxylase family protein [Bacteroidota bacterium]
MARIHKEGFVIIPLSALLIGGLYAFLYWLIPIAIVQWALAAAALIFWILIVRFFRVPAISTPTQDKRVIAPANGKVVVIEDTHEDEYLDETRKQISIFMSPLDVHVNRAPVDGKVSYYKYHPGKYLVAWHPKSSTDNERTSIGMTTSDGVQVLMRQIAGAVARRIAFYKSVDDELSAGDELGFIRFGSRVDVFLPTDAVIHAKIGDKTVGGETVIATLP